MEEKKPELICDLETGICKPAGEEDGPQSGFIDLTAAADDEKTDQINESGKAD